MKPYPKMPGATRVSKDPRAAAATRGPVPRLTPVKPKKRRKKK